MSVYAVSTNGKESWKRLRDPRKNPDFFQELNDCPSTALEISRKSTENFLRYFADKHKDRQHRPLRKHNVLDPGTDRKGTEN